MSHWLAGLLWTEPPNLVGMAGSGGDLVEYSRSGKSIGSEGQVRRQSSGLSVAVGGLLTWRNSGSERERSSINSLSVGLNSHCSLKVIDLIETLVLVELNYHE